MNEEYLSHHGILGQKWGIRRYQNADGTLTDKGRIRYRKQMKRAIQVADKELWWQLGQRKRDNVNRAMDKVKNDPEYLEAAKKADKLEKVYKKEFQKIWDKYHHEDPYYGTAGWLDLAEVPSAEKVAYQQSWEKALPALREKDDLFMKSLRKNGKEILSAKLKDIGYDDTELNREMLKEIYADEYGSAYLKYISL